MRFLICKQKGLPISNLVHKFIKISISKHFTFAKVIHSLRRWDISKCWLKRMIIPQVSLGPFTIQGRSKMYSSFMQHDAICFEEACNCHANCRNVNQRWCLSTKCYVYHHKLPPMTFQRIGQYIRQAAQLETTFRHDCPGSAHQMSLPEKSSEISHEEIWSNSWLARTQNFCANCQNHLKETQLSARLP